MITIRFPFDPPRPSLSRNGRRPRRRNGAVLVEAGVLISVLLLVVLGTIDLAMAVTRYNLVSQAARQGARAAIVHGKQAPPRQAAWGPATYTGTAADKQEIAQPVRKALAGLDPNAVTIRYDWPDGANAPSSRVQCTVITTYRPVVTSFLGFDELALSATSTMTIAH